jgi:hypothetical protein
LVHHFDRLDYFGQGFHVALLVLLEDLDGIEGIHQDQRKNQIILLHTIILIIHHINLEVYDLVSQDPAICWVLLDNLADQPDEGKYRNY